MYFRYKSISLNMAKKYFVSSTKRERINQVTGEYESVEDKKLMHIRVEENENFYMVFFKYMASFWELTHATDIKLIFKLCELAKWETGKISLSAGLRDDISKELKVHTSNLSKSLGRLRDKRLISGDRGEYMINPAIFWRGSKGAREELLKTDGIILQFSISTKPEGEEL